MVTWLFPVLPVFLVDAGPWRVDAVAMSRELQITSFCAPQRMDAEILAAAHNGGSRTLTAASCWPWQPALERLLQPRSNQTRRASPGPVVLTDPGPGHPAHLPHQGKRARCGPVQPARLHMELASRPTRASE